MSTTKKKDRGATRSDQPPSDTKIKGVFMEVYHHPPTEEPSILVLFELREEESWKSARGLRASWDIEKSRIHTLDVDHVIIELIAGTSQSGDERESA